MQIHGHPGSPNTWKARAVAHQLGIPLELVFVDLAKGAQRDPAYIALNPTSRTPTLVDGDFRLWESAAILHYLAADSALWPKNKRDQADVLRWMSWQLAHLNPTIYPLQWERIFKRFMGDVPEDTARTAAAEIAFHVEAKVLDAHLEGRDFMVGDGLSLADFSVGAAFVYAGPARIPLGPYANIQRWFERVRALPCWDATEPKF